MADKEKIPVNDDKKLDKFFDKKKLYWRLAFMTIAIIFIVWAFKKMTKEHVSY